ncbi:MAG: dipeptidyl carboxypeptidase II, partial [Acidobacteriota bacterium]|nr:dipeptidyl carboxypeptidase II [Acidobacteriota bacterium]
MANVMFSMVMKTSKSLIITALLVLAACTQAPAPAPVTQPAATTATVNPLFEQSTLPFQAPPFDRIKDSDYKPAIGEGMKRQLAEIQTIAANPDAPTLANTIEAMERSGSMLARAGKVFFNLAQSNTNDAMQKIEAEESPKLAAHQDAIYMNPKLYARVKALYDQRTNLGLDAESQYLIERYYKNFVRAGAQLNDADQAT